jgi:hypothetical protein
MHWRDISINHVGPVERIESISCEMQAYVRYLYQLAAALRDLSPESKDRHVWDLEEKVRQLEECGARIA